MTALIVAQESQQVAAAESSGAAVDAGTGCRALECSLPIMMLRKAGESFSQQMAYNCDDESVTPEQREQNRLRAVSIDGACRDYAALKKKGKLSAWLNAVLLCSESNRRAHDAALVKNEKASTALGETKRIDAARRAWMLRVLEQHVANCRLEKARRAVEFTLRGSAVE